MSRITGTGAFVGVTLVFSRVVFKTQRSHFVRGSSSRQLHVTVDLSCCFRERVVFPDHTWKERNNKRMTLVLLLQTWRRAGGSGWKVDVGVDESLRNKLKL